MVAVGNWDVRARNMVKWCSSQWQKIKHRGLCHQHTKSSHGMYVYCIYIYIYTYIQLHTHIYIYRERERYLNTPNQPKTTLVLFFLGSMYIIYTQCGMMFTSTYRNQLPSHDSPRNNPHVFEAVLPAASSRACLMLANKVSLSWW